MKAVHFYGFFYTWAAVLFTAVLTDNLIMVQVIWRHGDRSPTKTFKNDPNQESAWPLGFGQLTPQGMEQHMILGDLLYKEYVEKHQFLNRSLSFNQMYIRSTDVNRTYISAYSNIFGMYYNRTQSIPGVNFPQNPRWPGILVPFPVHAVTPYQYDYAGNPLSDCPRREWLWSKAKNSPQMIRLQKDCENLLKVISEITGDNITLDELWYVRDSIFIENLHNKPVIINSTLFDQIDIAVDLLENYEDGVGLTPTDGINFEVEIAKVRGGGILWAMINNFDLKLFCLDPANEAKPQCKWMKNVKYYAFSSHDNVISALMATLGAKTSLVPIGYPSYSSCLSLELWNTSSGPSIRMLYHQNHTTGFDEVTRTITGCENLTTDKCRYSIIRANAKTYYPGADQSVLCQDTWSPNTNMWEEQPTPPPPNDRTTSDAVTLHTSLLSLMMIALAIMNA